MKRKTISRSRAEAKPPTLGDIAWVKALPGRRVRDPKTMQLLPENGKRVHVDQHWLRRVKAGDVALGLAPATLKSDTPVEVDTTVPDTAPEKGED